MLDSALSLVLVCLAVLVILLLAAIAIFLHWQLHLRKKRAAQQEAELAAKIAKKRQEAANSLRFIAQSYLAEQVELAEAGIRISKLLDYLAVNEAQRAQYRVFDEVNQRLKHIPILQAWKDLPKKEKRTHMQLISEVENEFKDFAFDAAKSLSGFNLEKLEAKAAFYSAA